MDYLDKYGYKPDQEKIAAALAAVAENLPNASTPEALRQCFAAMDLTTLRTNDTPEYVRALVDKVNKFPESFPGYPEPASICVYPNFAGVVREAKNSGTLHVTCVSSCFPSAQSFLEV